MFTSSDSPHCDRNARIQHVFPSSSTPLELIRSPDESPRVTLPFLLSLLSRRRVPYDSVYFWWAMRMPKPTEGGVPERADLTRWHGSRRVLCCRALSCCFRVGFFPFRVSTILLFHSLRSISFRFGEPRLLRWPLQTSPLPSSLLNLVISYFSHNGIRPDLLLQLACLR